MAQVDFSNANIEIISGAYPLNQFWMSLQSAVSSWGSPKLTNSSDKTVVYSTTSASVLTNTASKFSIRYTGTFGSNTPSGSTEFGICSKNINYTDTMCLKVTNVSFSSGDTYDFIVDVDVLGS